MTRKSSGSNTPFLISNVTASVRDEPVPQGYSTFQLTELRDILSSYTGNRVLKVPSLHLLSNGILKFKPSNPEYIDSQLHLSILPINTRDGKFIQSRGQLVYRNGKNELAPTQKLDLEYEVDSNSGEVTIIGIKREDEDNFHDFSNYFKIGGLTIDTILRGIPKYRRYISGRNALINHLVQRFEEAYEHLKDSDSIRTNLRGLSLEEVIERKREERNGEIHASNYLRSIYTANPYHFMRYNKGK